MPWGSFPWPRVIEHKGHHPPPKKKGSYIGPVHRKCDTYFISDSERIGLNNMCMKRTSSCLVIYNVSDDTLYFFISDRERDENGTESKENTVDGRSPTQRGACMKPMGRPIR